MTLNNQAILEDIFEMINAIYKIKKQIEEIEKTLNYYNCKLKYEIKNEN